MTPAFLKRTLAALIFVLPFNAKADEAPVKSKFFDAAFANAQGGMPCYGRTYDEAHLKTHPQQTVRRIEIDMVQVNASAIANTAERFELGFAVMTKTNEEWYGGAAICKASAENADCYLDGDGGRFKLTAADDGALRLETGNYGIAFEGGKDFISLSGTEGDDQIFVLKPGGDECDAASKFFDSGTK